MLERGTLKFLAAILLARVVILFLYLDWSR